jgi:hypothetical protein
LPFAPPQMRPQKSSQGPPGFLPLPTAVILRDAQNLRSCLFEPPLPGPRNAVRKSRCQGPKSVQIAPSLTIQTRSNGNSRLG